MRDWHLPLISGYHQMVRTLRRDLLDAGPKQWRLAADTVARLYIAPSDLQVRKEIWHGLPSERVTRRQHRTDLPDIIWIHGGGFAFGSPRTHRAAASALAKATCRAVRLVDYPLAPEHPFPAALDALAQVPIEGPMDIVGDSAGGNLALAWALSRGARDRLILLSPWLDLRVDHSNVRLSSAEHSVFDLDDLKEYASLYLGTHSPEQSACSPLLAANDELRALGPILLESSKVELLHGDSAGFAARAEALQLPLTWVQEERAHHGWQLFPDILPEAQRSVQRMRDFLAQA